MRFFRFSANSWDDASKVEEPIVLLARVDTWVATVVIDLTELETQGGQEQELYGDTQRNMLEHSREVADWER